jgi:hypothetical protein
MNLLILQLATASFYLIPIESRYSQSPAFVLYMFKQAICAKVQCLMIPRQKVPFIAEIYFSQGCINISIKTGILQFKFRFTEVLLYKQRIISYHTLCTAS